MISRIKENAIDSLQTATTHGVPHLARKKHTLLKVMWTILILVSASSAIYFVFERVLDYLEFKVTTEVRLEDTTSMDFPTITICDKNKLSTEYSVEALAAFLAKEIISEPIRNNSKDYGDKLNDLTSKINQEFYKSVSLFKISQALLLRDIFSLEEIKHLTASFESMLLGCKFDGVDCNDKDFKWVFNEKYGNCYRFNWNLKSEQNVLRKTLHPGKENGLVLNMYVGLPKKLNKMTGLDRGVFVSIDSNNANPFVDLNDVIDVQAGLETTILIQRSEFYKYPKPYSNCDLKELDGHTVSPLKQLIEESGYSYSQNICLEFCKNHMIANICNCTQIFSSMVIPKIKVCDETKRSEIKCVEEIKNTKNLNEKCLKEKQCPLECQQVKYDHSITSSIYPSFLAEFVKKILIERKSFSKNQSETYKPEKDLLKLHIYYGSMSYLKYKESPRMTVFALVSSIGGTLGLFMGMSVLSFAEFFEIFLETMRMFYNEIKEKRRPRKEIEV